MSLRSLRGALAPSKGYVCLQCRLYNTSIKIYRTRQSQITLIQSTCSAAKRILTDIRATKKAFCTSTKVSDGSVKVARARIARRVNAKSLGRTRVGRKSKSSQDVDAIVQSTDIRQGHEVICSPLFAHTLLPGCSNLLSLILILC